MDNMVIVLVVVAVVAVVFALPKTHTDTAEALNT